MGKGGGVETPPPSIIDPGRNITNEDALMSAAAQRTQAAMPWAGTLWRPMDFLFGMNAPMMQVPQFQPQMGTSMYGSQGYSQGMPQGSPMAFGMNPWLTGMLPGMMGGGFGGMFPPALNYAGGTQYAGPFQPTPQNQQGQQQGQQPRQGGTA